MAMWGWDQEWCKPKCFMARFPAPFYAAIEFLDGATAYDVLGDKALARIDPLRFEQKLRFAGIPELYWSDIDQMLSAVVAEQRDVTPTSFDEDDIKAILAWGEDEDVL